ncbi:hypothetical protein NG798_14160 [Ancylothrix sp. C2]|uniref:hypothetical protein n=1 Tax=Ancylothrix sp. D3o TaxID=2953691 RepID=UPI0021BB0A02|nr:hypothetical protein [Ancylothrix sp. D3o]MCT7950939.1 hypothetical protein [Ancylothrix sp. D3o]
MFIINWRGTALAALSTLIALILTISLVSCGNRNEPPDRLNQQSDTLTQSAPKISEVSPPPLIQQLRDNLNIYRPQVAILSPKPEEILADTTVKVRLQVQDLPVFKNSDLGLGPHLHLILDNQPYIPIYDLNQPITLENITPGTHTLRLFATTPWYESFKNEGAYTQTTFHILSKTFENTPEVSQPLLTYSQPQGSYGAEPIMLDFYLTNAPLHLVANQNLNDEIADWRIRVTVNGETFILDRWDPIYLKGFTPGKNWVQIEFLDEQGNPIKNTFNNTVRLITYDPKGQDTLSKLLKGELSASMARALIDPTFNPPPEPTPAPEPEPPTVETPTLETPTVGTPTVETPTVETPALETPALETPTVETPALEEKATEPSPIPEAEETATETDPPEPTTLEPAETETQT